MSWLGLIFALAAVFTLFVGLSHWYMILLGAEPGRLAWTGGAWIVAASVLAAAGGVLIS